MNRRDLFKMAAAAPAAALVPPAKTPWGWLRQGISMSAYELKRGGWTTGIGDGYFFKGQIPRPMTFRGLTALANELQARLPQEIVTHEDWRGHA